MRISPAPQTGMHSAAPISVYAKSCGMRICAAQLGDETHTSRASASGLGLGDNTLPLPQEARAALEILRCAPPFCGGGGPAPPRAELGIACLRRGGVCSQAGKT